MDIDTVNREWEILEKSLIKVPQKVGDNMQDEWRPYAMTVGHYKQDCRPARQQINVERGQDKGSLVDSTQYEEALSTATYSTQLMLRERLSNTLVR